MSTPVDTDFKPRTSTGFATEDVNNKGGVHVVADIAARNAIPPARRKAGMFAVVQTDTVANTMYQLQGDLTTWVAFSAGWSGWTESTIQTSSVRIFTPDGNPPFFADDFESQTANSDVQSPWVSQGALHGAFVLNSYGGVNPPGPGTKFLYFGAGSHAFPPDPFPVQASAYVSEFDSGFDRVAPGTGIALMVWTNGIENDTIQFDQFQIEVSTNSGIQYTTVFSDLYNGQRDVLLDLSQYAGMPVRIRFRCNDDDHVDDGVAWLIDNVVFRTGTWAASYTPPFWETVRYDASNGGFPIQLPDPTGNAGKQIKAKNMANSGNLIAFSSTNGKLIDGSANFNYGVPRGWVTFESDGTNWLIVNGRGL